MGERESAYPRDWLKIADKDWARARLLLDSGDPELAGFCLQQAVEKYLKAFLLAKGWQLRRIHNLDTLLDDAVVYIPQLENYREVCIKATAFYFVERYPLIVQNGVTEEDVKGALEETKGLVELLHDELDRPCQET